jgi:predicted RNase H-like HicB family nuclease
VDVASQGQTIDEALRNRREAVALYLAEAPEPQLTATPLVTAFQVPGVAV